MLNLPVVGEETLNLHTFGSLNPKQMKCKRVRVTISDIRNSQKIEIDVLESPQVYPSIMSMPGDALCRKMDERGMPLADILVYGMENQDVGILIGAYCYWRAVTGQTERFPDGLVAVDSMFRWLIQGTISSMQVSTKGPTVDVMHKWKKQRTV